jgi:hypothetical protein
VGWLYRLSEGAAYVLHTFILVLLAAILSAIDSREHLSINWRGRRLALGGASRYFLRDAHSSDACKATATENFSQCVAC